MTKSCDKKFEGKDRTMAWQAKARPSLGPCLEQCDIKGVLFVSNADAAMGGTVIWDIFL